ncbi:hypothetical protein QBC36DRAFT_368511, partial [Triangularia setosa]
KLFINKLASKSLNKSVGGGAAVNHVSKLLRVRTIGNLLTIVWNSGKLLYACYKGKIGAIEVFRGIFVEVLTRGGDMAGWLIGGTVASWLFPGFGIVSAIAIPLIGSTLGGIAGEKLGKAITCT